MRVEVWVPGIPVPQGSMSVFGGRIVQGGDAARRHRLAVYRADIQQAWSSSVDEGWDRSGPKSLRVAFRFERPAYHLNSKGGVKPIHAYRPKITSPDLDKLGRAVMDALSGLAYTDDSQVTSLWIWKRFAEPGEQPGSLLVVEPDA